MAPKQVLLAALGFGGLVAANNGIDAWLRYARLPDCRLAGGVVDTLPSNLAVLNADDKTPLGSAHSELRKGFESIVGKPLKTVDDACAASDAIVVATAADWAEACGGEPAGVADLEADGFYLSTKGEGVRIIGQNQRGALYGAFEYLSMLAQANFTDVEYATSPESTIRWANEWANLDPRSSVHGSVERGYGGPSIYFDNYTVVEDLTRTHMYGRLLASIRINGIVINNVNANPLLLSDQNLDGVKRIADTLRPWGIRVGMSLNFASPQSFGGLSTFDPLDQGVINWWQNTTDNIYRRVPDFAGYLVKANSEGQPGPLTYNRTMSQGANMFAKALRKWELNGQENTLLFRAFVYNAGLDWKNWKADRANAAVEFFKEHDGEFDDNVVVQIKYGPIDFQVREPPSPLFANLFKTNTAIELQISQEYMGHQCHWVYLAPLWKTILDFDMRVDGKESYVRDIVTGKRFGRKRAGFAGVVNVGMNTTWLGSHVAMSNLYAYGRLAWNTQDDSEKMLRDWTKLTFGHSKKVMDTIVDISMKSWPAYENYSGNLGIQTLVDILYAHYGPNPRAMDNNGWGQWTRADTDSLGMDRTVSNGTGNAGQYPTEVAQRFEKIETTPDNLLLWFHHVPYTQVLKSGKTVIQHFYDAHYEGAATAQKFVTQWESLKGLIDEERYEHQRFRQIYQAGHAITWRDAINNFYNNLSSIPDEAGRVGNYKYRIEGEKMTLDGYKVVDVFPPETASKFKALVTTSNTTKGTVSAVVESEDGVYDIAVNYFDLIRGKARWELYLGERLVGEWNGNAEDLLGHWPSEFLDGHSAIRKTFRAVEVKKGETIRVVGYPQGAELAPLDYISILPQGIVD